MKTRQCRGCEVREDIAKAVTGEGLIDDYCKGCRVERRKDETICFWEGGKDLCRKCWECKEHYR